MIQTTKGIEIISKRETIEITYRITYDGHLRELYKLFWGTNGNFYRQKAIEYIQEQLKDVLNGNKVKFGSAFFKEYCSITYKKFVVDGEIKWQKP